MAKKAVKRRAAGRKATKRRVTKQFKEPTTARQMLDLLDRFLSSEPNSGTFRQCPHGPYVEAKKLWDVLSALRGPDNGEIELKAATTQRIRSKAFPRCANSRYCAAKNKATFANGSPTKVILTDTHQHFSSHIAKAAEALGLEIELPFHRSEC